MNAVTHGIVAAGSRETARAGAWVLAQNGNAVDAAVAAAFASFIAEIAISHLGGSGVAQTYVPETGTSTVYDFFSTAPGLGIDTPREDLDFPEVTVSFGETTQDFRLGRGSVAVPGNIFGLCQMAMRDGRLPLRTLLEPAIQLARNGVELEKTQTDVCKILAEFFTRDAAMRAIFAPSGRIVEPGERIYVANLAETLEQLALEGEVYCRSGRLAQAILEDQRRHGGLLTHRDLLDYRVLRSEPVRVPYRDHEILLPPPCSSGGVLTAFALKLLSAFDVASIEPDSLPHLQLLIEVQAATSRARQIWDIWERDLTHEQAVENFLVDSFVGPYVQEVQSALWTGKPSHGPLETDGPEHTTHISVVDENGMAVSLTTSAGESAGFVVPGTGYIPNNMLGEADLHPHGFHKYPPGFRFHTMMTPVVALLEGNVDLVLGTGGSNRIRSTTLQVLMNVLDHKMSLEESVQRPRVHFENGVAQCEKGISHSTMNQLENMGYKLNRWKIRSIFFGGAHAVGVSPNGEFEGAGDERRGGAVARG